MQRLLIVLGLVIIPFYEILLRAFPFVVGTAPDSRVTKEIVALVFALAIGLLAVFHGNIKPFKNKFFLLIPIYLFLNLIICPHIDLFINNNEVGDFYFWKPFCEVLCFSLMIIAVASMEIDFDYILRIMVICGFIMSIYVFLQAMGLDQFWVAKKEQWFTSVRAYNLGGNLGQPTVVASFMVMMVPLAFYLRKYWMALSITVACLLTHGAMVTMALGLLVMIYLMKFNHFFIGLFLGIFLVIGIGIYHSPGIQNKIIDRMDGRWTCWKQVIGDIRNGQVKDGQKLSITGIGLGRFSFIFPSKHNSNFQEAHNDTMEFVYDCGLIGGFLLIAGIVIMIWGTFNNMSSLCFAILLSFISIFFCSLGSFPFQLGAHQFYAAVLVGLLHNDKITRRT